jgi:hypothetical protein
MALYNLDRKTYSDNISRISQVDLYTFEYPWDSALENIFTSKTKITFIDTSASTERLEAEHYAVFQVIDGGVIGLSINPTGSATVVSGDTREEYDLLATPTNYYPHLQFPDNSNIFSYFQFWITGAVNPDFSNLLRIKYSIFSPDVIGKIIVETDLRYAV